MVLTIQRGWAHLVSKLIAVCPHKFTKVSLISKLVSGHTDECPGKEVTGNARSKDSRRDGLVDRGWGRRRGELVGGFGWVGGQTARRHCRPCHRRSSCSQSRARNVDPSVGREKGKTHIETKSACSSLCATALFRRHTSSSRLRERQAEWGDPGRRRRTIQERTGARPGGHPF